ncbi:MAG: hypothetical protein FWD34_08820 [Oscillospiraceae bacterium]|nr:hypothetical protein [Oscillospiraceae bacterium]
MKKITALLLITMFLLTSCTQSIPQNWQGDDTSVGADTTVRPTTQTEPATEPPSQEEWYDSWLQPLATDIAQAFIEKNTEFLSQRFCDDSKNAFNFINELDFIEFEQFGKEYTYGTYIINGEEEIHFDGIAYYFYITVENGTDDMFTLGGREWELRLFDGEHSRIQQFSPKGKEINRLNSDYASMCYSFSNDLYLFESMSDFNLLKEKTIELLTPVYSGNMSFGSQGNVEYVYYYCLLFCMERFRRLQEDDQGFRGFTVEEFMEYAEYTFGITNIDGDLIRSIMPGEEFFVMGHGWWWHYSELVSEEITQTGAAIIINYYGDAGYLFVAKTMKYNLEFGDKGVKLISVECLYSNDDLVLSRGAI